MSNSKEGGHHQRGGGCAAASALGMGEGAMERIKDLRLTDLDPFAVDELHASEALPYRMHRWFSHSLTLSHTHTLSLARALSLYLFSRALSRSISRSRSFSRSCPPHIYVCMCVCVHTHTHRFKDLPASERVIQDYACAMQSGVSYQPTALVPTGRMFISANFVGFSSQVPVQKRQKS